MKNEYTVTKEQAVVNERLSLLLGKGLLRALWALFGIIWICVIIFLYKILENPVTEIILCVLIAVFCAYKAFFDAFVRASIRYKLMARRVGKSEWVREIALNDEQITVYDGEVRSAYKYSQIKEIAKYEGFIALITVNNQFIWLKDDGFKGCTRDDFLAKIVVKKEMTTDNI